jgi:peptidase E
MDEIGRGRLKRRRQTRTTTEQSRAGTVYEGESAGEDGKG